VLSADVSILSMRNDFGPTPARTIVSVVDGVQWMLQTVDHSDVDDKFICNDLHSLTSLLSSNRLLSLLSG